MVVILKMESPNTYHWSSSWAYLHYSDVIMGPMVSQITSFTIVYSTVYSGADKRKHQSSASLAFVWGIHRSPVNSPHKGPVTRKMLPFDDVIMCEIDVRWMPHDISDDKTLVQEIAWCHQATSITWTNGHLFSMSLYGGVTRRQWVKNHKLI